MGMYDHIKYLEAYECGKRSTTEETCKPHANNHKRIALFIKKHSCDLRFLSHQQKREENGSSKKKWTMRRSRAEFGSSSTAEEVTEGIDASRITAIITGATSGVGRETARILSLRGAQVVIGARNVEAANHVKEAILQEAGPCARVHVIELNISSLQSVRKFVLSFKAKNLPLNLLINNAGIMGCPFSLSADGIELQFATNYLGHFLLTNLLLDKMKSTAAESGIAGRIVNVSSMFYKYTYDTGIRMHKINEESGYSAYKAYGQSKLAMILHSNELARRFNQENVNITINSVHPGAVPTNLARHSNILAFATSIASKLLKSIPQGAATQCFVALHPSLDKVSGKYFSDCKESITTGFAKDPALAERLWQFSTHLTSTKSLTKAFRERNESLASRNS
ncbi:hypothetical protein L7F22_021971 [Adiantum nelumboides]|nr:hypothetical protein [Adiantum nelumboides]